MRAAKAHRSRSNTPALADAAYVAAFEVERSRVLRRRITVCLGIILALLTISGIGEIFEYQEVVEGTTPWMVFLIGATYDVSVACMSIAFLLYVLTRKPERRGLVTGLIGWALAAIAVIVYFEMRRSLIQPTTWMGENLPGGDPHANACRWGIVGAGVVIVLSLVIVPMRWRESRWIGLGGLAIYLLQAITIAQAGVLTIIGWTLVLTPLALGSMAFSHWRYTLFDADFEHQELKGRFGEMSSDLAQARALHESLFPAPVGDGPVRVGYVYEPMREIGGDFLFMPACSTPSGPTCVVLIDVSGHGVGAALAVNRLHGELTRLFAADEPARWPSPAAVMAALNSFMHATLAPQGVFATGVCLSLEPAPESPGSLRLRWCSAGHPPAFLRSAAAGTTPHALSATTTMLGVLEPELFDASERSIAAVPGDQIIAYTDGLIETRDQQGQDLGAEEVRRIVGAWTPSASGTDVAAGATPRSAALMAAARAKRGTGRVSDDTLIVEMVVGAGVARVAESANEAHGIRA